MNRTKCQESSPHISLLDTCAKSVNDVRSAHRTLAKEKVVSRRLRSAFGTISASRLSMWRTDFEGLTLT